MLPNQRIYDKPGYFARLIEAIEATPKGGRVYLATMAFEADVPAVQRIFLALCAAAKRGVQVKLIVDAYPFLLYSTTRPGPLFYHTTLPAVLQSPFRERYELLTQLEAAGGKYHITNQPRKRFTLPHQGRSHIKCAVIGDEVIVGSCNLESDQTLELSVGWRDAKNADWLAGILDDTMDARSVVESLQGNDITHRLSGTTSILIDAGRPKQSCILDAALAMVDAAKKHIYITCQYMPDGAMFEHLQRAHRRGVVVTIIYNHPSQSRPFAVLHKGLQAYLRLRGPAEFFSKRRAKHAAFLHAKLLVADDSAIIGSHNYVAGGVRLGTAEIAVVSHSGAFTSSALSAFKSQL